MLSFCRHKGHHPGNHLLHARGRAFPRGYPSDLSPAWSAANRAILSSWILWIVISTVSFYKVTLNINTAVIFTGPRFGCGQEYNIILLIVSLLFVTIVGNEALMPRKIKASYLIEPDHREKYVCPECEHILADAVQISCGHLLCYDCAEDLKTR